MRAIVATEAHFLRAPNGLLYSDTGGRGYEFWSRYLDVFESVCVLARVSSATGPGGAVVTGPGVSVACLPGYRGPEQYLWHRARLRNIVARSYDKDMACIARVPGAIGAMLVREALRHGRPFGLEVVGDPDSALAPGAVKHPLRALLRARLAGEMRAQCRKAAAIAYVTKSHLQKRYPPSPEAFTTYFSSVELPPEAFAREPRPQSAQPGRATLVHVGTQSQWYKGHDILLKALRTCRDGGLDLDLVLIGDGKLRPELEAIARSLNLAENVRFLGQIRAGAEVRAQLDQADLFVMPSRTEGLPRAMIEAMARALPCIGSQVGGIPELLPEEDMVPPDDPLALCASIASVLNDPPRMARMSARNLQSARRYCSDILRERRRGFYDQVRNRTSEGGSDGRRAKR